MRLLSRTGLGAAVLAAVVFTLPTTAAAISFTDGDEICRLIPGPSQDDDALDDCGIDPTDLTLLYKVNEGGEPFAGSYSGSFTDSSGTITYDGAPDPTIECPTCYLVVKDGLGAVNGGWYIFDLNSWDGEETITLSNLFPGQGGISHISIWGGENGGGDGPPEGPGPEPASLVLLGMGLVAAGARMRRART